MPSSEKPRRPNSRVSVGRQFEQLAADFFRIQGYKILDHNWQAGRQEIDLVVQKDNLVVFVEVKSASTRKFGHPAERVDRRKIANLTRAAQKYIADKSIAGCDLRFDVVAFVDGVPEHFPGAFEACDEA
jgi:putative endonuclease